MDKEYEKKFVAEFFYKNKRERALFELFSRKMRREFFHKMDCYFQNIVDAKYCIEIEKPNSDYEEIFKLLKHYGALDTCYVISPNDEIDGQHLSLIKAIKKVVGLADSTFVICNPSKLAYYEGHLSSGAPPRYILYKEG